MIRTASTAALLVFALGACDGGGGNDAGDAMDDLANDLGADVSDAADALDAEIATDIVDVSVDVTPAMLPGRWRLVGWQAMGAGGSETLSDVDQFTPAGHARVDGTLWLDPASMSMTFGRIENGHFTVDTMASPGNALSAWGSVMPGTLGAASFTPSGGAPIAFATHPDGTVSASATAGARGRVTLTWQRADVLPALSSVTGQGLLVRLAPSASESFAAPRAVLAWDRPGMGTGYSMANDVALTFVAPGVAAFNALVTAPPSDAVGAIDGTRVAVAYLVVYDDRDRDGRLDLSTSVGAMDGGVPGDAASDASGLSIDIVRAVSPIGVVWRGGEAASMTFMSSAFRETEPGLQLVLLRADPTVPGGTSFGLFDTTMPVPLDSPVEVGPATRVLPDVPGPI